MITRSFNPLTILDKNKSILLLGPRGVGKSALIEALSRAKEFVSGEGLVQIDLLKGGDYQRYLNPGQLIKELSDLALRLDGGKKIVSIDEVQKIPALLDEVHFLIENFKGKLSFFLSGSSARKLKRGGANLLAGRAINCQLFPLSQLELDLSLSKALLFGTLPGVYLDSSGLEIATLESYVSTYLREEVQQESLVRRIDRFAKFLEFAAQSNGQPINFSKLGKQLGIAGKTVAEYFSILSETLIVHELSGWSESVKRQLLQAPRYYFFDCGVLNALNGYLRLELRESSYLFGNLFETFIINQLLCSNHFKSLGLKFYYWRDKEGHEVDLILARNAVEPLLAVEIKSGSLPQSSDCPGFQTFKEEYPNVPRICVCTTPRSYLDDGIRFVPWKDIVLELQKFL